MRLILWLSLFLLRCAVGIVIRVLIYAVLGRGPAARTALWSTRLMRRLTRL